MTAVMKSLLSIFVIAVFGISLPASDYKIKTVKILPIESYPARTTVGGVTIAANPYTTNRKSYSAFDTKRLNSRGYFPIHLIIKNESPLFLNIRTRKVILLTASGQQLYTTPAAVVVDDLFKDGLIIKPNSDDNQNDFASPNSGTPLSDFTNKELASRLLEPGTLTSGFIFFFTTAPKENLFAGSTLYIPKLEDEGSGKGLGPFMIPLGPALRKSR